MREVEKQGLNHEDKIPVLAFIFSGINTGELNGQLSTNLSPVGAAQ